MKFKELREELKRITQSSPDPEGDWSGAEDAIMELCFENLSTILAALEIAERGAWIPAENAPQAGVPIIVLKHSGEVEGGYVADWGEYAPHNFSHWMPLPLPPEEK